MSEQTESSNHNDELANEAIKRILLDMVVRGHGDRLIGRWSRQPELQKFLEQVPYLLDRINQLHLVCARRSHEGHGQSQTAACSDDEWDLDQVDGRRGHLHHFRHHTGDDSRSPLRDFISLIGREHHWLVRTRDALGLTPLHKAILHSNRPIAEYIIDRYADELAATSWRPLKQSASPVASKCPARLLDAQDRYGRTALHYAAGQLAEAKRSNLSAGGSRCARERRLAAAAHLYQLLVARGASQGVQDFRGKTAAEYARQPGQLRARSILHLANKLNASYQANVLTKTLRVTSTGCSYATADTGAPEPNRPSMSVSCADLSVASQTADEQADRHPFKRKRSRSSLTDLDQVGLASEIGVQVSRARVEQPAGDDAVELSSLSDEPPTNKGCESATDSVRRLKAERSQRVPVDERTRRLVCRALADANLARLSELLVGGLGELILAEMPTSCWNIHCRRYVSQIVPRALRQVDELHERIAANEPPEVHQLLSADPILARLLRPYKRASMNALHVAVYLDRRTLVSELIRAFPELVNARDSLGCTCLHWAARSLRQDRLYRWLLDHFGAQLEQVRDLRGKLAADYRQQAIRLATFSQRSVGRRRTSDARELLERSQLRSGDLCVGGVSSSVQSRRLESRLRMGKSTSNARRRSSGESLVGQAEPAQDTPTPLRPTSLDEPEEKEEDDSRANSADGPLDHFGVVPCTSNSSSMDTNAHGGEKEIDEGEWAGAELASGRVKAERRTLSARESQQRPANGQQTALLAPAARRHSDCVQTVGVPKLPEQSETPGGSLGELASLDAGELAQNHQQHKQAGGARDSPLATSSLPLSRPLSASNRRQLDSMIVDAISGDNFERLERLLLAGCGQRLLRVYGDEFARAPQLVSARMRLYLTKRAPEYLATIERIHSVVHECYALTADARRPPSAAFHRLCSLLVSGRLIMSRDRYGASPLHIALIRADRRLADYLLRRHPGAASAPDYDGRHSLHYAALALSAHQQHGNLHLHPANPPNSTRLAGFWPLDAGAQQLHEDLCSHYADLAPIRDRLGFTCAEYLSRSADHAHVQLANDERLAPSTLARCCPEYASILERYNYLISTHDVTIVSASASSHQVAQVNTCTKSKVSEVSEAPKPVDAGPSASSSQLKQRRSDSRSRSRSSGRHRRRHRRHHHHHSQHSHKHSGSSSTTNQNHHHRKHHRRHHKRHSHRRHQHHLGHTHPVLVPPNQVGAVGAPSRANQSVVGGVIVPTIMHNDKLDEIETYDIIYKQAPSLPVSPVDGTKIDSSILSVSSSSSSFSGSQGDSDSITDSNNEHDDRNITNSDSDTDSYSGSQSGSFSGSQSGHESGGEGGGVAGKRVDSDDSLSDDSQSGVGERVGRLTSEFERRVRREKSELRAKVDQIMDEIKLSAKSSKTTKLLGQNGANESSQVMQSLLEDKTSAAPTSRASVASSSGRSSASNLTSSGVSRTVSSASSNSTASACSSTSSTLNGNKQQQQALQPPEGLGRPDDLETPTSIRLETPKNSPMQQQQQQQSSQQQPLVSKNAYGQTYLHFMASRAQSPSTLYKVLERSSKLVGERDLFYRSARDVAVQFNLTANVQTLDKFIIDQFIAGNAHLLRHLLHEGYSPLVHVSDADGNDITLILKLLKLAKMLRFLVYMADFQRWRDELHTFIRNGYFAGASKLARKHRELIGARSAHSRTSLHLAVLFGRRELVDELLELSPPCVHLVDNMGRSALHYAYGLPTSSSGSKRETANDATSSSNNNGDTNEISESDTEYIRRKLAASGANVDLRDVRMRTPKFYFIFKREIDEIRRMELEFN